VARYPILFFKSKTFKKVRDNNYKLAGDLTMHGNTRTVELNAIGVTAVHPGTKKTIAGFKITGKLMRSNFGIGTSVPAMIVGEAVRITANAEFEKQ
jgi:polyisoprenoid-binding protein YceI